MRAGAVVSIVVLSLVSPSARGGTVDLRATLRAGDGPVQHGVLWLAGTARVAGLERERVVLDQRNIRFEPRVLVVRTGTTVEMPNNDRVLHNVFSFRDGKRFDLGLYPVGAVKHVVFDQPGVSRVFCNIHPNMAAYVLAVDSPYFAVTDADGHLTIPRVPPGSYTFHAWRPGAGEITGPVTVEDQASLEVRWP